MLECSQLWKEVVTRLGKDEYPDIELSHMYIDNAAMQLVRNPKYFDVIVTGNIFGDILSDEASMIVGSLGMLPSASLGDGSLPGGPFCFPDLVDVSVAAVSPGAPPPAGSLLQLARMHSVSECLLFSPVQACTSQFTDRPRTLPARTSRTRWHRSCRPP